MKRLIYKMKKLEEKAKSLKEGRRKIKLDFQKGLKSYQETFIALGKLHSSRSRLRSVHRIRKVCSKTGRARGVYGFFSLCGREIVNRMNKGYLPGLRKSSW